MLLDLQDVVYMTEQGLCAPENWPPKHSAKFFQEFKQEELEPAESTMEDSKVTPPKASSTFQASQEKKLLITSYGISFSRYVFVSL